MRRRRYSIDRSTPPAVTLVVRLLQVLLGLFFLFSSITKGIDPMGTGLKITEYLGLWGMPVDLPLATTLAVGLNVLEGLIGAFLLLGIWRRGTPIVALLFMIPMTCLTLYIYVANPVADCGCFGDALKISNGATLGKNVVLLLLLIPLLRYRESLYRLGRSATQWITGAVEALLLGLFNNYQLLYLPVVDFRPYKEGTPMSHFVDQPADDGMRYIYEREGEERAFTTDELASVDSTWTYVRYQEQRATVAQEKVSTADFILLDSEGHEVGHRLAAHDARALLYIVHDLDGVTGEELWTGLELQQRLQTPVTLVMTEDFGRLESHPSRERIRHFDRVLFMDHKMAQTVIRSSPGLVVISDGVLLRKLSYIDLKAKIRDRNFLTHIFKTSTNR